jgi:hypothetical protein
MWVEEEDGKDRMGAMSSLEMNGSLAILYIGRGAGSWAV